MVKLFVNLAVIAATVAIAYARPQVEKDESSFDAHPNGCPISWDIHHLLPHETDCTLFYYCVRGEKVERQCSPGTHFNRDLQVCDWPENAGCGLSGGGSGGDGTTSEEDDVEGSGDPGNISEESLETEDILPNGCPADFDNHKLLPHETECNLFYYCVFGEKVARECAPGTYFNYEIQVCDWPENVDCANSGSGGGDNGSGEGNGNGSGEGNGNGSGEGNGNGSGEGNGNGSGEGNGNGGDENDTHENGCPVNWDVHQLLPHETECNKFYHCVHGEKHLRECGPGTHFNPTLQVCDWPHNAGCGNSGNGDSNENSGGSSNENNNSANSNEGDNGDGSDENNNNSGNSNESDNGDGGDENNNNSGNSNESDNGDGGDENNNNSGNSNESDNGDGGDENNNNSGNSNEGDNSGESTEWLPNGCPADWDIHHLLPHETECNRFYQCVHGNLVLRECGAGTHFNPTLQVCDWPDRAGCANSGGGSGSSEEPDNGVTENPGNGSGENPGSASGEWTENGCPTDWDIHHLIPHETECNLFYYCVHGKLVSRECAPGTHFNPLLQVCDWPSNAGCANGGGGGGGGGGSGSSEEPDNGVTEAPGSGSGENPGSGSGEWLGNGCPADWNIHHLLPHENDCTLFYYCVHGDLVARECRPGLHFNPVLQVCDWPDSAGCANGGGNTDSPGSGSGEDNNVTDGPESGSGEDNNVTDGPGSGSGEDNNITDGPGSESGEDNNVTDGPGSGSGEDNNVTEGPGNGSGEVTDGPGSGSGEWLENGCPGDWQVNHLLPHENDCTKFYQCVHGNLVESTCAPGTHFNAAAQKCDWPENAGCANNGGNTDSPGSGSGEVTEGDRPTTQGPGDGSGEVTEGDRPSTEGPDSGEVEPSPQDRLCASGCNVGNWGHETDCDKFWRCDGNRAVLVVCSEGLHFNAQEQTCDFICNVSCVRDTIQATVVTNGLKLFVPWDKVDDKLLSAYKLLV